MSRPWFLWNDPQLDSVGRAKSTCLLEHLRRDILERAVLQILEEIARIFWARQHDVELVAEADERMTFHWNQ